MADEPEAFETTLVAVATAYAIHPEGAIVPDSEETE